jgi:hypothetical protein|tara:strand:+ start:1776 stop:2111 length:336 start_codon:yes stop_codon:yes gene_type:complete
MKINKYKDMMGYLTRPAERPAKTIEEKGMSDFTIDDLDYKDDTKKKTAIKKKYAIPYSQSVIDHALKTAEDFLVNNARPKPQQPNLILPEDQDLGRGIGFLVGYTPKGRKL